MHIIYLYVYSNFQYRSYQFFFFAKKKDQKN